jgi:hypothetical protein
MKSKKINQNTSEQYFFLFFFYQEDMSIASNAAASAEKVSHAAVDFFQKVLQRSEEVAKTSVERSTDLLYATEARWKDLTLQQVLNKGTRKALAVVGVITETKAPLTLQHRERSFVATRRIVEHIHREFDCLTKETEALALRFQSLCGLLAQFRLVCDAQVSTTDGPTADDSSFVHVDPSPNEMDDEDDKGIAHFRRRIDTLLQELKETVSVNCCGLSWAAMRDMDASYKAVIQGVELAATNLDLCQRSTTVAQEELKKTRDEMARWHTDDPRSAPLQVRLANKEGKLSHCEDELTERRAAYVEAIRQASTSLFFAQEQTSMSMWSAYQILFSQMTHFFSDASTESASISKVLAQLKNKQKVSLKISAEKKLRNEENTALAKNVAMDRALFGEVEEKKTSSPSLSFIPASTPPAPLPAPSAAPTAIVATAPPPSAADEDDFESLVAMRSASTGGGAGGSEVMSPMFASPAAVPSVGSPSSTTNRSRVPAASSPQWEDIFS